MSEFLRRLQVYIKVNLGALWDLSKGCKGCVIFSSNNTHVTSTASFFIDERKHQLADVFEPGTVLKWHAAYQWLRPRPSICWMRPLRQSSLLIVVQPTVIGELIEISGDILLCEVCDALWEQVCKLICPPSQPPPPPPLKHEEVRGSGSDCLQVALYPHLKNNQYICDEIQLHVFSVRWLSARSGWISYHRLDSSCRPCLSCTCLSLRH